MYACTYNTDTWQWGVYHTLKASSRCKVNTSFSGTLQHGLLPELSPSDTLREMDFRRMRKIVVYRSKGWDTEVQHQRLACMRTAPAYRHGFRLEYLQGQSSSPPNRESMNDIQNALFCERSQSVFLHMCVGAHVHFSPAVLTSG